MSFVFRFALFLTITFAALIAAARWIGGLIPSDEITFLSWERGGDILSMDVRSGQLRTLVGGDAIEDSFAWSPDGMRIAFASNRDVFVMDANGSHLRQISGGVGNHLNPVWSPDGQLIVYEYDVSFESNESELWLVDLQSGDSRLLTDSRSSGLRPVWMSDSRHMIFISNRPLDGIQDFFPLPKDKLVMTDVQTGTETLLYMAEGEILSLDISPDGRTLAFTTAADSGNHLHLFSLEEQKSVRVLGDSYNPDWSPDSSTVVYLGIRGSLYAELCVLKLTDDYERCLTQNNGQNYYAPRWSPDGKRIVFHSSGAYGSPELRIMLINADGSDLRPLTGGSPGYYAPAWRPVKEN